MTNVDDSMHKVIALTLYCAYSDRSIDSATDDSTLPDVTGTDDFCSYLIIFTVFIIWLELQERLRILIYSKCFKGAQFNFLALRENDSCLLFFNLPDSSFTIKYFQYVFKYRCNLLNGFLKAERSVWPLIFFNQ